MSKEKSSKWTSGTLRSRGWTEEMMRTLLPRPHFRRIDNRSIRSWDRETVLKAEETPEFTAAKEQRFLQERENAEARPDSKKAKGYAAVDAAAELLTGRWNACVLPDTPVSKLAALYHAAILDGLPGAAWAVRLKGGQAVSYIDAFLSLAGSVRSPQQIPDHLRRLVTAGPWLGRNPDSPAAERLKAAYVPCLQALARAALGFYREAQPEADVTGLLAMEPFPVRELLKHPLGYVYSVHYVPTAIRSSLSVLVALNPKDEYPDARRMQRHFILHLGGTNTGKTYDGIQRLMQAETGVYLAPLRLLALEAQETLLDAHVRCSLTTGEEEDVQPSDTHVSATCEKLDIARRWDVAVIDECQMISDPQRGYAWTRAILGVLAPEVHLCAAPEARNLLLWLIDACGDTYEIIEHERKTPLLCMKQTVDYDDVKPGDALITFSKIGVLSIAEDLRARGKKPAIIYGALPYSARRKQMEGFLAGEMRYVVSTDAIGMGLNLPIRRIIFMESSKFDGTQVRPLTAAEIKQIAGRAGRFGMYDKGYVSAAEDLASIREGLEAVVPPLTQAVAGFSELVLQVDFDLLEVLQEWSKMPTPEPYVKLDVSRYISVISRLRADGFHLTREQELRAANIPFDETDPELQKLFNRFLRLWEAGEPIDRPALPERNAGSHTLPELEEHCRKLDLYFSFSKAFSFEVDTEALADERERTAESINEILLHNLKNNIRFCAQCGAALALHYRGRLCPACFRKRGGYYGHTRR